MKRRPEKPASTDPILASAERASHVYFQRKELTYILNIYGQMVAAGIWRDYSIESLKDRAIFSVYEHSADMPSFRIVKEPKLANRQGGWYIQAFSSQIVKRGRELPQLLKYFDKLLMKLVD